LRCDATYRTRNRNRDRIPDAVADREALEEFNREIASVTDREREIALPF
jgi:hypothetical protein